jgi:hypothetical protein
MKRIASSLVVLAALLAGCSGIEDRAHPEYLAIEPIEYPDATVSTAPATGSLFVPRRSMSPCSRTRGRTRSAISSASS